MQQTSNNKRIAKNTLFLYFRMIFILIIKLFISREVLSILGVEDFGLYNLVAGIIVMFSFLNTAMDSASQRFFNIALGVKDTKLLKDYFINSVNVHFIIGIITIILGESIGLYLIYNRLSIPADRFQPALFVFQFAILSSFITIIRTPYNALVIAYEKMSFYAILSILESILNLSSIYILLLFDIDKLKLYSVLTATIALLILLAYIIYCNIKFPVSRYRPQFSKKITFEMLSFSLWSTLSSFANITTKQGINIILNMFIGVTINAATAIMTQVSSAIYSFIQNFLIAANPQLIKSYACKDWEYLKRLFYASSKISFYLMLILSIPCVMCMDEILSLWLTTVPEHSSAFCSLSLFALIINTLGGPIWTTIQASGKIKKYQLIICVTTLLNIPCGYALMTFNFAPEYVLTLPIITNCIIIICGLKITIPDFGSTREYFTQVLVPIIKTSTFSLLFIAVATLLTSRFTSDLPYLVSTSVISVIISCICVYFFGLLPSERDFIQNLIKAKLKL